MEEQKIESVDSVEKVTKDGVTIKITKDTIEIPQPPKIFSKDEIVSKLKTATSMRDTFQKEIDQLDNFLSLMA